MPGRSSLPILLAPITYKDLQPGRDLPVKSSSDKSPAPREIRTPGGTDLPVALQGRSPQVNVVPEHVQFARKAANFGSDAG
jgi:hypothetical protein